MSEITLIINDGEVKAKEGMTVLDAARSVGIDIPTLCDAKELAPFGACRLCTVEIVKGQHSRLVASCVYPVEDGLVVKTESESVVRGRKLLLQLMWARAPGVTALRKYGARYGISEVKAVQDYGLINEEGAARFKKEPTFCVLCGLCVRYCAEVKKENAIGFIGKGTEREVAFFPEIARRACPSCQKCFGLCPTGLLQDQYTLVQMARPAETKTKTAKQ